MMGGHMGGYNHKISILAQRSSTTRKEDISVLLSNHRKSCVKQRAEPRKDTVRSSFSVIKQASEKHREKAGKKKKVVFVK